MDAPHNLIRVDSKFGCEIRQLVLVGDEGGEEGVVVIGVVTGSHVRTKTISNMEEMKARSGTIVLVAEEGDDVGEVADHVIRVPSGPDLLCTVTAVVPLQLLAYHLASARGLDVDKPRNLAKTVTVE